MGLIYPVFQPDLRIFTAATDQPALRVDLLN